MRWIVKRNSKCFKLLVDSVFYYVVTHSVLIVPKDNETMSETLERLKMQDVFDGLRGSYEMSKAYNLKGGEL